MQGSETREYLILSLKQPMQSKNVAPGVANATKLLKKTRTKQVHKQTNTNFCSVGYRLCFMQFLLRFSSFYVRNLVLRVEE